jgi:hypothetical protein
MLPYYLMIDCDIKPLVLAEIENLKNAMKELRGDFKELRDQNQKIREETKANSIKIMFAFAIISFGVNVIVDKLL